MWITKHLESTTAMITTFSNCFYNSGKKAKRNWKQTNNKKDTMWYWASNGLDTSSLGSYRSLDNTATRLWRPAAWKSSSNTQLVLVKILSLVLSGWSPVQWQELSSAAYKTPPDSFCLALGWQGLAQKPVRCPVGWEQCVPQGRKATANCTLQARWRRDEPARILPQSCEMDAGPFPEAVWQAGALSSCSTMLPQPGWSSAHRELLCTRCPSAATSRKESPLGTKGNKILI